MEAMYFTKQQQVNVALSTNANTNTNTNVPSSSSTKQINKSTNLNVKMSGTHEPPTFIISKQNYNFDDLQNHNATNKAMSFISNSFTHQNLKQPTQMQQQRISTLLNRPITPSFFGKMINQNRINNQLHKERLAANLLASANAANETTEVIKLITNVNNNFKNSTIIPNAFSSNESVNLLNNDFQMNSNNQIITSLLNNYNTNTSPNINASYLQFNNASELSLDNQPKIKPSKQTVLNDAQVNNMAKTFMKINKLTENHLKLKEQVLNKYLNKNGEQATSDGSKRLAANSSNSYGKNANDEFLNNFNKYHQSLNERKSPDEKTNHFESRSTNFDTKQAHRTVNNSSSISHYSKFVITGTNTKHAAGKIGLSSSAKKEMPASLRANATNALNFKNGNVLNRILKNQQRQQFFNQFLSKSGNIHNASTSQNMSNELILIKPSFENSFNREIINQKSQNKLNSSILNFEERKANIIKLKNNQNYFNYIKQQQQRQQQSSAIMEVVHNENMLKENSRNSTAANRNLNSRNSTRQQLNNQSSTKQSVINLLNSKLNKQNTSTTITVKQQAAFIESMANGAKTPTKLMQFDASKRPQMNLNDMKQNHKNSQHFNYVNNSTAANAIITNLPTKNENELEDAQQELIEKENLILLETINKKCNEWLDKHVLPYINSNTSCSSLTSSDEYEVED